MNTEITELVEQARARYLSTQELDLLADYIQSLPDRIDLYKLLRDREVEIMQTVADRSESELPSTALEDLEKAIMNLLLVMRYCAMGMLLNDQNFIKVRLLNWLEQIVAQYEQAHSLNAKLYKLLNQVLKQELSDQQLALMQPPIATAQLALIS